MTYKGNGEKTGKSGNLTDILQVRFNAQNGRKINDDGITVVHNDFQNIRLPMSCRPANSCFDHDRRPRAVNELQQCRTTVFERAIAITICSINCAL